MAFFLAGSLAKQVAKGFKGKLLVGKIVRQGATTTDEYGDRIPGPVKTFKIEGFIDSYSEFTQAQAGISDRDAKIVLVAGNCETSPEEEDYIQMRGEWWQVQKINRDPALATYECQSSPARDPQP